MAHYKAVSMEYDYLSKIINDRAILALYKKVFSLPECDFLSPYV